MTTLRGDRVGILGAGAVGTALALNLVEAGHNVTVVMSRDAGRASALARSARSAIHTRHAGLLVDVADIVFITVPDDAIKSVADLVPWRAGMAAVHCSGGTPVSALAAARDHGAVIGGFHPLQTFPPETPPPSLDGVTFAIESQDAALRDRLHGMAEALGGSAIDIDAESRVLYHISGVMTSNYLITLLAEAAKVWSQFGYNHSQALRALLPLIHGTVGNVERDGAAAALTGPIVRGDVGTVTAHLAQLRARAPGVVPLYEALPRSTTQFAVETKRLSEARGADILALLDGPLMTGLTKP